MRIISGSARGKQLATFSGRQIRPTADRVRESIFNILFSRLGACAGKSVLDLYAGTGAMALEALSRGARRAVLIDSGADAARLIPANLRACRLEERATFLRAGVLETLPKLTAEDFDLIFIDPPYGQGLAETTVAAVARLRLLAAGGIICVETEKKEELPAAVDGLERFQTRLYGAAGIHFYCHSHSEGC